MTEKERLRTIIEAALRTLKADLAGVIQTTHASFFASGTIENVCCRIADAHNKPSAFNASELSQAIQAFLVKEKTCA